MISHVRSTYGREAVVSLLACLVPLLTGKVIKAADAEPAQPNLVPDFLQPQGGGLSRGSNDTFGGPQEGHFHGPEATGSLWTAGFGLVETLACE